LVQAYVLITAAIGKVKEVLKGLKKIEGVKSAHVVTGPYDVIVFVEAKDFAALTNTVLDKIHEVEGVIDTNTAIVAEV
jgi:DNA-binding Lrp family transcriptional regulator